MIGGLDLSSFGGRQSIGHLLFLLASLMTACYTVAIRRARVDGLHAAAIAAVVSLLLYLPAYLVFFENELFRVPVSDLVFQALYQGVLTAAISLALYGGAIHLLGASNAAAFVALGPIMAALMAIPVLGEWPSHIAWADLRHHQTRSAGRSSERRLVWGPLCQRSVLHHTVAGCSWVEPVELCIHRFDSTAIITAIGEITPGKPLGAVTVHVFRPANDPLIRGDLEKTN